MAHKGLAFLVIGTVTLFLCSISSADVPDSINYQGKLTKAGGGPVNGTFDMTFSIYPDTLPGTLADWSEPQAQVEVERGIFAVLLGSVNPIPASLFDGRVKYLGVQVDTDPEMRPLKPMVTTAYAFRSQEADTAEYARSAPVVPDDDWTIVGDNIYREQGNVGIGTSSPVTLLHLSAATPKLKFTDTEGGNDWDIENEVGGLTFDLGGGEKVRFHSDGNVGIGMTAPGEKLSVAGTIQSTSGGFRFPDGSVQTTAASVGGISIITGSANHNDLITPPGGYTVTQCKCIVSPRTFGPMGSSGEGYSHWCYVTEESGGWRVYARSRNTVYGHYLDDSVNYMVIGTK